jgi:hypothetical protein
MRWLCLGLMVVPIVNSQAAAATIPRKQQSFAHGGIVEATHDDQPEPAVAIEVMIRTRTAPAPGYHRGLPAEREPPSMLFRRYDIHQIVRIVED